MFKNRAVLVKLEKTPRDVDIDEYRDPRPIEEKAAAVLHIFEEVGIKIFVGVCLYVLVDTHRQVAVAKASRPR